MTGQADCPQCGAIVVTHADRCHQCGYVPGMVDGWRPLVVEVVHADGSVRLSFEAVDRVRLGAQDAGLELRDVVLWDFDGQRIVGPTLLELKPGIGPEIVFPGRKAARLWCEVKILGKGPAILQVYERP